MPSLSERLTTRSKAPSLGELLGAKRATSPTQAPKALTATDFEVGGFSTEEGFAAGQTLDPRQISGDTVRLPLTRVQKQPRPPVIPAPKAAFRPKRSIKKDSTGRVINTLPQHLGGGVYYDSMADKPPTTPRGDFGGIPAEFGTTGKERDHIVSLFLGGVDTAKNIKLRQSANLIERFLDTPLGEIPQARRQEGKLKKELDIYNRYKRGEINRAEAITELKRWEFEQELKFSPLDIAKDVSGKVLGKVREFGESLEEAAGFTRGLIGDTLRFLPRTAVRPLIDVSGKEEATPEGFAQEFILGDEPIRGFAPGIEEATSLSEALLKRLGVQEDVATGSSLVLGPMALGVIASLDLTPFAGFGKAVGPASKAIAKLDDLGEISKTIRKSFKGTTPKQADDLATALINVTDPNEVELIIRKAVKPVGVPKTTRRVDQVPVEKVDLKKPIKKPKRIHADDQAIMSDFTDYVSGELKLPKKQAIDLELDAVRIAERYKIPQPKTLRGLANEFGRQLDAINFKRPEVRIADAVPEVKSLANQARKFKKSDDFVKSAEATKKFDNLVDDTPEVKAIDSEVTALKEQKKGATAEEQANLDIRIKAIEDRLARDRDIQQGVQLEEFHTKVAEPPGRTKTAKLEMSQAKKSFAPSDVKIDDVDLTTTRNVKQSKDFKDFAKYAEDNLQEKDIRPAVFFRHSTMTAERVAEFLDGGIGGRTYNTMIKPVYEAAERMGREGEQIKNDVRRFRVLEGSKDDVDASLFAQGKKSDVSDKAKEYANYARNKYDEFLERINKERVKVGAEPIKKRKDYVTHLNELNVLTEMLGGIDNVSTKKLVSRRKSEILDQHPDWSDARAFSAAKREVEGTSGLGAYIDAKQPTFRFAKKRLSEYEKNPSLTASLNAYSQSALRYIHQAENVAKNKAFKDVLPPNAREFMRLWNTEQVAGRTAPSFLNPTAKRALSALRGTIGANTILGNMATTLMQLTSLPQTLALAGARNTFHGYFKRLVTYVNKASSLYDKSRAKALRDLDTDIGLGDSLIDQALKQVGKFEAAKNPAARTRQAVDVGRELLKGIMKTADQFTVGATYEAFYIKGIKDGLSPEKAKEFAEIMTGKTQANYFKEALPPFLNTVEGKTLGQFGTFGMNQWEMFKRDFGKEFNFNAKSERSKKQFFNNFMVFLTAAYLTDAASEEIFGRQPFDIKDLVDETQNFAEGEASFRQVMNRGKDTAMSYVPYMGSIKFKSLPPVLDFGKDVITAFTEEGPEQSKAVKDLREKWTLNTLLPYGGNQLRKSLQGLESIDIIDTPLSTDVSRTSAGSTKFKIDGQVEKAKAILFGAYATEQASDYFEGVSETEKETKRLKDLPPEQAAEEFERISEENPSLGRSIRKSIEDEKSGITDEEKRIRGMGVANGDRARAVLEKLNALESNEEKGALWEDYTNKKIITEGVRKQLLELLQ